MFIVPFVLYGYSDKKQEKDTSVDSLKNGRAIMDEIVSMYENLEEYDDDCRVKSCFFTGHRKISDKSGSLLMEIKKCISYLYSIGVREFHSGGAIGFDTLAATIVIDLKRFHPDMKLVLNLPYHNQASNWSDSNVEYSEFVKKNADKIIYSFDGAVLTKDEARKYLLKRNRDMVDCSKYGIAYYSGKSKSGTGYTLRYAKERNCEVVNVYDIQK